MLQSETEKLRSELINWVNDLSDIEILFFLDGIRRSHSNTDWWDELSDVQKNHINKGLEEAKKGNTISSAEFWKRLKAE